MSDNSRIAKNTIFMYVRMAITMFVGLYTSRVVLRVLGVEDYGLYNVIGGIIALFAVLNNALINTTSRFITISLARGDIIDTRQTFNMAFLMHCAVALFLIVIGETVGLWYLNNKLVVPVGREFAAAWLYQFTIVSAVLATVNVPYNACVVAHEEINIYAILQVIDSIMRLGIVFIIQIAPHDKLIFYAVLMLLVMVFNFLFNYVYCQKKFKEVKFLVYWDRKKFKEILKFVGWALFGNFSNMFYTQGINLMLNAFCGPAVNAARGIAVQVQGVVAQMANNVQTAINPQILKTYSTNDLDRMHMLICASSRFCYYLLLVFSLPIMLEANYILQLWLGIVPAHTVSFIRLTLMTVLLDAFINPMFTANLASGRLNIYYIPVSVVSVLFMFMTYYAIKCTLMPESTFLCYLAMVALGLVVRVFVMRKQVQLRPSVYVKAAILPATVVTLLASVLPVASHLMVQGNTARLFVTLMTSVVSMVVVVYSVGITRQERFVAIQFARNKLQKYFS